MSETVTFGGLLRQHRLAASLSQVMLAERARLSVSAVAALERGRRIAPRPGTVAFLAEALGLGPVARAAFIRAAAGAQVGHTGGLPLPRNLTGVSATQRRNLSAAQTQLLRVELATASPAEPRDPALIAARLRQSTPSPVLVGSDDDLTALERTLPKRVVRHAERAPAGRRHNLPAPHRSLIGREGNAATVRDLVTHARGRLVTLTGAGGCGKTQLALKVATDLVNAFEDGVWFVDLASLHVPDLVPYAVAAVLGPRGRSGQSVEDTLLDYLTDRNVLLVLDNCEHLIDVCASLADRVLSECPQVRLLATSREPLRIQREITWRVPSLALPDDRRTTSVDELAQSPSVQLFMERAKAVEPAFVLTARNAPTIGQICRRLDGLPLGIELAAARLRALGVDQILERLEMSIQLLVGGSRTAPDRQQTMRATLDWSDALLTQSERVVFRRLAVFAGGWSLDAAEAVCTGDEVEAVEVLELLSELVAKSLVLMEECGGRARYRLLEPIRQYAWERLLEADNAAEARQRHLAWSLGLAEQADPKHPGSPQAQGLTQLEADHDNLRAALAWSIENDPQCSLRLAARLAELWRRGGHHSEGRRWLDAVLAAVEPSSTQLESRARVLLGAGQFAVDAGEIGPEQVSLAEDSVRLFRESGNQRGLIEALQHLGRVMLESGRDVERVHPVLDESLRVAQTLGDQHGIGFALANLAYLAWCQGRHSDALELFEQSVRHIRASGDALFTGLVLGALGWYTFLTGDVDRARRYKEESLAILRSLDATEAVGLGLLGLAHVARAEGYGARLRLLLAESGALLREAGSPGLADWLGFVGQVHIDRAEYARGVWLLAASGESDGPRFGSLRALFYLMPRDERDAHLATARSAMGEVAFQHAWAEGRAMAIDQAVDAAVAELETDWAELTHRHSSGGTASPLTPRQQEVTILVAEGLTNRQIADRLVITERTAGAHIEHILDKLSVGSRAQIAVWAFERGLLTSRGD